MRLHWRPNPPTNARIKTADGQVKYLALTYTGVKDGLYTWEADGDFAPGDHILIDKLPGRTQVNVRVGPIAPHSADHHPLGGGLCVCGRPIHTRP